MFDKKLMVLAILLMFSTLVLAAAPTVGLPTVSPSYTNDLNYFKFPVTITALASGDVNGSSLCWTLISTGGTALASDFNSDANTCSLTIASSAGTGDFNFSVIVQNTIADANGTSPTAFYWRDSTAPTTSYSVTQVGQTRTVTLTCTDSATNTGLGSDCNLTQYRVNSGAWTTYSTPFVLSTLGTNTVDFNSTDNLSNVETTVSLSIYVGSVTSSGCGILNLAPLVIAAVLLIAIGFVMTQGGGALNSSTIVMLVIVAVSTVIAIIIMSSVLSSFCVV